MCIVGGGSKKRDVFIGGKFLTSCSLKRLKRIAQKHLKRELEILEEVSKLSGEEANEFFKWFMGHPYRKGIEEFVGMEEVAAILRGADKKIEIEEGGVKYRICKREEKK